MSVYNNFLIIGGGGGNEIANKIYVYDLSNRNDVYQNKLTSLKHEEPTGKEVANYLTMANNNLNVVAACMGAQTVIYKIAMPQGKLEELKRI